MNLIYVERHAKLREAREELRGARDSGASDIDLQRLQSVIDAITHDISRFERETIGVQIIANANKSLQQEWFITMSDYQKPIGRGESVRMDEKTNLTNAAKQIISSHSLFAGEFPRINEETPNPRVDERKDNVARGSGAIYSLANIRD